MARDETPQDRKARSLARDRRNAYGENDKSSRTAIRQRKRWANRIYRQAFRQAVQRGADDDVVLEPRHAGRWRKSPDIPLAWILHRRRLRRLERDLRARLAEDPIYLDRLERAAVSAGLDELAARMILRQLHASMITWQRDDPAIPDAALDLLQRLVRRLV